MTVPVTLKPGYNTVRMGNSYNWAPDIDCFTSVSYTHLWSASVGYKNTQGAMRDSERKSLNTSLTLMYKVKNRCV